MANYCVSTAGSNSNSGLLTATTSAPWLTLSYAAAHLSPGDTLDIFAGTYTGSANVIDSQSFTVPTGTAGHPITVRAYQRGTVIIQPPAGVSAIRFASSAVSYWVVQDLILDMINSAGQGEPAGGPNGIYQSDGTHNIYQRLEVKNAGANGIAISDHNMDAGYNQVLQCHLHDNGLDQTYSNPGYGAYIQTSHNVIDGCHVHDNHGYGLQCTGTSSNGIVRNNRIHDNYPWDVAGGVGGLTGGGIALAGQIVAASVLVYNNLIYHNGFGGGATEGNGLLLYNNTTNCGIYRNTIYNNRGEGIHIEFEGPGNIIRNNIAYGNAGDQIHDHGGGTGTPTIDHNVTADPSFVDAATGNFALQSGSVARGAGIVISAVTTDYMGTTIVTPFDCGAYQYRAGTLVADGMNLQTAINAAVAGGAIILQAGRRFTGTFTLPVHSGSTTITIQSACDLPTAGTQVTPTSAANYAVLVPAAGGSPVMATVATSHDWTLLGLTFLNTPTGDNDIITLGDGSNAQNTLASIPTGFTVDRCLITGDPLVGQKRAISLNAGTVTIKQCYISGIFRAGQDSQAIAGWNGSGPWTIDGNYLEAGAENILIGGATIAVPNLLPTGITITNNTITKLPAWRGQGYNIKNLIELKTGVNVTIDSNVCSYTWGGEGQAGYGIVFTVRNEEGSNPWATIRNVVCTRNTITHCGGLFNILGIDDRGSSYPSITMTNVLIQDTVAWDIDGGAWSGSGVGALVHGGDQLVFDHNTIINTGSEALYLVDLACTNLSWTNNLTPDNGLAIFSTAAGVGTASLNAMAAPWICRNNIFIACPFPGSYPPSQYFPVSQAAVGFTDLANHNYQLLPSSPYITAASDGAAVGARFGVAPDPPPPPPPPPPPDPPSAPINPSPASGATSVATSAVLGWNLSSNASTYDVYFGTVPTPVTRVSHAQAGTTYTPTLAASTTYYWQVIASGLGGTATGAIWTFTTAAAPTPPPPPTPAPDAPANPVPATGATNVATATALSWSPSANATTYDVYFGTGNPPLTRVSAGQAGTSYTPTLTTSTTYYWRVVASGPGGATTGIVWSFRSQTPPASGTPSAPTPVTGAIDISLAVTLAWSATTNTTSYTVLLDTVTPPVVTVSVGQVGTSYLPSVSVNTTYYWQIIAVGPGGSTPGPIWHFTTDSPAPTPPSPPGTPSNPTPTNEATGVCPHATLSWQADAATTFDVVLDTVTPPTTLVSQGRATGSYPHGLLAYSTTYYWQITAINDAGRTAGPIWSFTTAALVPGIIIGGSVGTLLPWVKPQFLDATGTPVAGGTLYFYVSRTTTLLATFADVDLTIPNTNPVQLNSAGQSATSLFLQATGYTVVLRDSNGVQLWSVDDVEAINATP